MLTKQLVHQLCIGFLIFASSVFFNVARAQSPNPPSDLPPKAGSTTVPIPIFVPNLDAEDPARNLLGQDNKSEWTGFSRKVTLPTHAFLGQGYSVVTGGLRGQAMEPSTGFKPTTENAISYDLRLIDNYEELAKSLRITASASFSGATGGFSAGLDLFNSTRLVTNHVYILLRMTVISGTEALSKFELSQTARSSLVSNQNNFLTAYGTVLFTRL